MAEGIDHQLTRRYLDRRVDARMVALIDHEVADASALDVGCGSGLYGPALRRRARGADLRRTRDTLEAVATGKLVITVPNRLFPHTHMDPTHVLRYRLSWLLTQLNRSRRFAYTLHPLGLASHWRQRPWCRRLDRVARRVAALSATVLYLGHRVAREVDRGVGR